MADLTNSLVLLNLDGPDRDEQARKAWEQVQNATAMVISDLNGLVNEAIVRRKPIEERWLQDLRQYHGIYEESIKSVFRNDDSRSEIFINITRPKTNAWVARLGDMLFPNDERNWGIDPTPVPQLTSQAREMAAQADDLEGEGQQQLDQHNAMVDQNGGQPIESDLPAQAQAKFDGAKRLRELERQQQREIEIARKRAAMMQRLIDDQLTESNYPAQCRDVIADKCKLGSGVLKGPIINDRPRGAWEKVDGENNVYQLTRPKDPNPKARRVDPWHFFPDPSAQSMDDCEYTFERHLPNRKQFRRMAKELGFNERTVARLLREGPRAHSPGPNQDLNFISELRSLESQTTTKDGVDSLKDRYCVWEYHGPLEADQISAMLHASGRGEEAREIDQSAALEVPMVRIFFCGNDLLLIDPDYLLDSGASMYSVATFEKGEATVLGGVGVPRLMRSEQAMLNSAMRMMMDNAALAAGPQVVIDKESIEPENGRWKLTPRKVWQWITGPGGTKRENPFQTFDIPMNQEMLAAIVQLALRFVDEAVAMPLIAQGEMGAHVTQTSSGMSMLFNSANVGFRRVVKNWDDDVTQGMIARFYDFNMQFSERQDVKGDMKVEARGTSVLLVREIQAEQLMAIIREWSTHPILGVGFRAYHAMRMVLQAMSINPEDLLIPEEDYLTKLKQMAESSGQDNPEQVKAQTAIEVAKIDAQSRSDVAGVNLQIAQVRAQTAFAELAKDKEISLAQIDAMFRQSMADATVKSQVELAKLQSDERKLAVEVAIEEKNKRDAEARGLEPTGSGGAISMGAKRPGNSR